MIAGACTPGRWRAAFIGASDIIDMGKVSIALRGWRFDEAEVFDENDEMRPVHEMPDETRERLVRLTVVAGQPCDACWLIHDDEQLDQCRVSRVVYGEPLAEIILCDRHEPDFLYWYREADGSELRGTDAFQDEFHAWFADGGRAPEGYVGIEHVDTDPDAVPQPDPDVEMPSLEEEIAKLDDQELDALGADFSDLDV
jgi:hypothetical protein